MAKKYVKPEANKFGLLPLMGNITSTPSEGYDGKDELENQVEFEDED